MACMTHVRTGCLCRRKRCCGTAAPNRLVVDLSKTNHPPGLGTSQEGATLWKMTHPTGDHVPFDTAIDYPEPPGGWGNIYGINRRFFPMKLKKGRMGVMWKDMRESMAAICLTVRRPLHTCPCVPRIAAYDSCVPGSAHAASSDICNPEAERVRGRATCLTGSSGKAIAVSSVRDEQ